MGQPIRPTPQDQPRFELGQLVATPGAIDALASAGQTASESLSRHARADWGDLSAADSKLNDDAIAQEGDPEQQQRIVSVYHTSDGSKLYCISEWDRSATTIMCADEY